MSPDGRPPLVSVVMIFLDARRFLDEAVASVLAQTYPDVELLLVDDGSTDGSSERARAYEAIGGGRVRVCEHPGHAQRGMSASRNLGIERATGAYVAFLDADDVWSPRHLEEDVAVLRGCPEAGMACGRALEWHSWDGAGARDRSPDRWSPLPFGPGTVVPPPEMLISVLRRGAYSTPICSLLVRANVLRATGGAEARFAGMFEDQVLLAKLHLQVPAVISGSLTAFYRQHPWSASSRAMSEGHYDPWLANPSHAAFLDWLDRRPELQAPDVDEDLRASLDTALAPYRRPPRPARARVRQVRAAAVRALPPPAKDPLRRLLRRTPRPGRVRLGSLRRREPISRQYGYDRGLPVDRWYIERFLAENAGTVRGRVLEVGDSTYTHRYGGPRVTRADVLNVADGPGTTFAADLADAPQLPSAAFDCVVLTQTLHLIYDLPGAVRTVHRVLRPGGVVLATVPGISQVSLDEWAATWYWSLTPLAAARLFGDVFGPENVEAQGWGNVKASTAFLQGMAAEELREADLWLIDPQYPLLVTVRALRAPDGQEAPSDGSTDSGRSSTTTRPGRPRSLPWSENAPAAATSRRLS
jgi:SAM-dependent methyltransferase